MPSHDLLLDDPLDKLEWDAPGIDDDPMPWQAGTLVGAGDVEIFGQPPKWRRIGPRGVAAILGAVMLAGLAGLQLTGNLPGGDDGAAPSPTDPATVTTAVPAAPTSAVSTTAVPTTAVPTTAVPTSAAPTSAAPTSTAAPATAAATTARPATVQPPTTVPPPTRATTAPSTATAPPSSTPVTAAPASSSTVTPQAAAPLLPVAGPVTGQSDNGQPAAAAAKTDQAARSADNTGNATPAAEMAAPPADTAAANTDTANTDTAPAAAMATPSADNATPSADAGTADTDTDTSAGAIDPNSGQPIHATANTNVGAGTTNNSSSPSSVFEPLRNKQAKFSQFAGVPSNQLDFNALTTPTDRPDNGGQDVEGQFRTLCEYSHISYDDPIVFPGQPGRSHLHMFFGNTNTDAFTTTDSLVNSGGGTCDGFELNRSAYWFPAMVKGNESVIAPYAIVVYYKTKNPANAVALPQGLKLVAGNPKAETFEVTPQLSWSCGGSGNSYNETNHIPTDCGTDLINATIQFANCWDGVNLDSPDHQSHVTFALDDLGSCPASHPKPIPQISILLYWQGTGSVDGWHLSSDNYNGFNAAPGSTLHADWFGGWNQQTMDTWMNNCIKAVRNCSGGQTGTDRVLAPINGLQIFEGNPVLPLPAGSYQMG